MAFSSLKSAIATAGRSKDWIGLARLSAKVRCAPVSARGFPFKESSGDSLRHVLPIWYVIAVNV
jgi:hypothetical protein